MRTVNAPGERLMTVRAAAGPRYAVYLCPDPRGPAGRAAAEWLGRCAERDASLPQPFVPGLSAALLASLTEEPRRYGFHATLKAPFRLTDGVSRKALAHEIRAIAAEHAAFEVAPLAPRLVRGFLALVPDGDDGAASALATQCVLQLDRFRAPATSDEIRARLREGLTPRQHGLLVRWGHAHVMDEFRLQYPLTGQVSIFGEEVAERLAATAAEHFAPVMHELRRIDRIALFEQTVPGAAFRIVEMAPLAAKPRRLPQN